MSTANSLVRELRQASDANGSAGPTTQFWLFPDGRFKAATWFSPSTKEDRLRIERGTYSESGGILTVQAEDSFWFRNALTGDRWLKQTSFTWHPMGWFTGRHKFKVALSNGRLKLEDVLAKSTIYFQARSVGPIHPLPRESDLDLPDSY